MHFKRNITLSRVLASSVAAILATTSLHAIPRDPCEISKPPICCDEPKPGPFAFSYPFDLDLNCPKDFYVHVDGLAMQAKQEGMEFAIHNTNLAGLNPLANGTVEGFSDDNHSWGYNPGIRVGIGFYLDHDAWNLDLNWTGINISEYRTASTIGTGGYLIPQWATGLGIQPGQLGPNVNAVWDASYNTVDLRIGKPYYVSRYLVFNPHFGLRAGVIQQHFSVDYSGQLAVNSPNALVHHADNNFYGVGGRAGIDTEWLLGKGWCLFGNFAASLLCGKFDVDQKLKGTTDQNNEFSLDYDFYQNVPNFEIALGLGWGAYFNKKKNHVGIKAAYEFHEWFNQLALRKFSSGPLGSLTDGVYVNDVVSRGNFSLNGFSLKLQLDM